MWSDLVGFKIVDQDLFAADTFCVDVALAVGPDLLAQLRMRVDVLVTEDVGDDFSQLSRLTFGE